jgi:hypothetical protein
MARSNDIPMPIASREKLLHASGVVMVLTLFRTRLGYIRHLLIPSLVVALRESKLA